MICRNGHEHDGMSGPPSGPGRCPACIKARNDSVPRKRKINPDGTRLCRNGHLHDGRSGPPSDPGYCRQCIRASHKRTTPAWLETPKGQEYRDRKLIAQRIAPATKAKARRRTLEGRSAEASKRYEATEHGKVKTYERNQRNMKSPRRLAHQKCIKYGVKLSFYDQLGWYPRDVQEALNGSR